MAVFYIQLVEHNDSWVDYYNEIELLLKNIVADSRIKRISHIESTAVNGIWAKPIIDIFVEIDESEDMDKIANTIEQNGFADKVYHLHLRYDEDNSELCFRDYLHEYSEMAKVYEQLKLGL